jgi:hypothetical protein
MRRVIAAYLHRGSDRQQTGRDPGDEHSLCFYQVAVLLADQHRVAVVASHGIKKKRCTCNVPDCERPGAHPRTPNGLQDATTDLNPIDVFWEKWPKAKVIIATGLQGVIAVTVKGTKGKLALKKILGEDESSLGTLQFFDAGARTYVWRTAADVMPEREVHLADGVIVHGNASFVVVPKRLRNVNRSSSPLYHRDVLAAPSKLLLALGVPFSALPAEPEPEQEEIAEQDADLSGYVPTYAYDESSPETLKLNLMVIDFDWIEVPDGIECDEKKVRALAESYEITGPRTPLVVRLLTPTRKLEGRTVWAKLRLVSDLSHFEALKRRGITCADCWVIIGDEADERLWKLAELIHQPERKRLDWAHLVMEWVTLVRIKAGQVAHPRGGRQPHDKGFSAAEKVLGISRRDLRRAERFSKISPDAQAVIRQAKLDDIQVALEEIANEPLQRQVEKALELKERYRRPRGSRRTNAPDTGSEKDQLPEAEAPNVAPDDDDESDKPTEEKPTPGTASTKPSDNVDDQPSALDRRAGDDEKFEIIKSLWDQYIADEWDDGSEKMQVRFIEHLGYTVVARIKNQKFHH